MAFFQSLHPDAQKQHAARIDGSHLAGLEERDAMGPPPMYGNLDGTDYGTGSDTAVLESADPIDKLQDLYAAQNNAQSNPDRSYRDMSQGAQSARGALASVNTGTSGVLPVTGGSLIDTVKQTFNSAVDQAEERRDNTSTELTPFGKYLFPDAGGPAVPASEQQQNPPMGMSFNGQPAALTDTTTPVTAGNNNGALTATGSQNTQPAANRVRASTGGYTGNARGSGLPDMQIGLGERLMRMGMAGLANASQGSLAQMGAMTGAYNDVNQANRDAEMGTFKIEEARRQAHAARVAKLAAAKAKGAGDMGKLKDFQAKNFGFYNRGVDAEKALMDTAGMGTDLWEKLKSNVPLFGNALVDPKYQRYDQARRNFVNAVLRRESGAVISDAEFENANIQYFPQFGDTEETLSQKQRNRQTTMEGIRMGAGPSIFYTPTYPMAGGGSTVTIGNMKITEAPAKTAK